MHIYKKREQVVTAGVFKDDSDAWLEQNEMEEEALYHKLYALEQDPPTSKSKKKLAELMAEWKLQMVNGSACQ